MNARALATLALAAALSSCGDGRDGAAEPAEQTSSVPVEPDGGTGAGAAPLRTEAMNEIPEAFRGVWDSREGSCDPASDLRIDIRGKSIGFYESHGSVGDIELSNPDDIVVDLSMEGEGEEWTMKRRFTLSEGGNVLTARPADGGEEFEPMPLKRCEESGV